MITDTIKALGTLEISVYDEKNSDILLERRKVSNLVLTLGKNVITSKMTLPVTTTATYGSGAASFTVTSATGISNGMLVIGAGIPANTYCTISGTTVTLFSISAGTSVTTTAAVTAQNVSFIPMGINFMEIGNPATASTSAVGDVSLNSPTGARVLLSTPGGTVSGNTLSFVGTFGSTYNATITEAGLWTSLTGGTLCARTTFPAVVKGTNTLVIVWNIQIV